MALTFAEVNTSSHVSNADWVRRATTALQRLQTDVDAVHRRVLTSAAEEASSDSGDDSSYEGSTEAQVDNLEDSFARESIQQINKQIMHLLMELWYMELNDLFEKKRTSIGFQIMKVIHDWELLKESLGEAEN